MSSVKAKNTLQYQSPVSGALILVEVVRRYSNPKTQQMFEALQSLWFADCADLSRDRDKQQAQVQRRLTQDQIKQVVTAYVAGTSMQQLAKIWNVHRTTISGYIRKAGVPRRF